MELLTYPFLVLSLLFALPGALIFALRPDLRPMMGLMALSSLPFALTESLFYPTYWEPRFLWDLVHTLGFGLEDLLFVVGLSALTSSCYAFASRKKFVSLPRARPGPLWREALRILALTFAMVAALALLGVPMIYGSCLIMVVMAAGMLWRRRDLIWPSLSGALLTTLVYTGLCLVLQALIPQVFLLSWHTEHFLHLFVWGVPVEELLYASTSGLVATAFYPYVAHKAFAPLRPVA